MSNPIGWCTDTINPISGCTNRDEDGFCQGRFKCYAEGFARRLSGIEAAGYPPIPHHFAPCWHQKALEKITKLRGGGKRIFLDSMSDWFCGAIPIDWLHEVLIAVEKKPAHHFLVLTKRPENIERTLQKCAAQIPENMWMGVSVCSEKDLWRIESLRKATPSKIKKFISFEPLHGFIDADFAGINWIIIGAESGNQKGKIQPDPVWIDHITDLSGKIPVFMKDNLWPYLSEEACFIREIPEEMRA